MVVRSLSAMPWARTGQRRIGASACKRPCIERSGAAPSSNALALAMHDDDAARVLRFGLVALVVACHVCVAWIVMRHPMSGLLTTETPPLFASLIHPDSPLTAPAPVPAPVPASDGPAPQPKPVLRPQSSIEAPAALAATPVAEVPLATQTSASTEAEKGSQAQAMAAAPAPVMPAPAAVGPRMLPSSALRYLVPPAPLYPIVSRRLGEAGEVDLKVLIGIDGRARHVSVQRSSGYPRLDDSAVDAVREARFVPYTEHGEALTAWTVVPIVFHLEH